MSEKNKAILERGNPAIVAGNNEGFLSFCADDTEWTFVGDKTLKRKKLFANGWQRPVWSRQSSTVAHLIAEGEFVTAMGDLTMKDEDGQLAHYSYCDIGRFRGGEIVQLRTFVIKTTG